MEFPLISSRLDEKPMARCIPDARIPNKLIRKKMRVIGIVVGYSLILDNEKL